MRRTERGGSMELSERKSVSPRASQNLHSQQCWQQKQGAEPRSTLRKQPERRGFSGVAAMQAATMGTKADSGSRMTAWEAGAYYLDAVMHGKSFVTFLGW